MNRHAVATSGRYGSASPARRAQADRLVEATSSRGQALEEGLRAQMQRRLSRSGLGGTPAAVATPPKDSTVAISEPGSSVEAQAESTAARLPGAVPAGGADRSDVDLSAVRIHVGDRATAAAAAIDADAFTFGRHIVFGADQYRPETPDGRRLIAHELTHVLRPSPGVLRQAKAGAQSGAEADYAEAHAYLTDFYMAHDRLLEDVYEACSTAVAEFTERSSVPLPDDAKAPPMATIKLVMGWVPGAKPVLDAISLWDTLWPVVSEVSGAMASKPEQPSPLEAASKARTEALNPYLARREAMARKQLEDREALQNERGGRSGARGAGRSMLSATKAKLGAIPSYSASVITMYAANYELELYRDYYSKHAGISRITPMSLASTYTRYVIVAIPGAVVDRVVALYAFLRREPKVSIDPRYDPKHAAVVSHLIDLGIPVRNRLAHIGRFGAAVTEEERSMLVDPLHTGDVLRQPYKGERYKEVK